MQNTFPLFRIFSHLGINFKAPPINQFLIEGHKRKLAIRHFLCKHIQTDTLAGNPLSTYAKIRMRRRRSRKDAEPKGSINRPEICVSSERTSFERKTFRSIRSWSRGNPDSNRCLGVLRPGYGWSLLAILPLQLASPPPQQPPPACQFDALQLLLAYSNVAGTLKKCCIPYGTHTEPQVRELTLKARSNGLASKSSRRTAKYPNH